MTKRVFKIGALGISILSILLVIAQFAIMCIPYINIWPLKGEYGAYNIRYLTGESDSENSGKFLTSTDVALAVDFYLEEAGNGYHLYFMNNDVKTYVKVSESADGNSEQGALEFVTTAPSEVFTFDTKANTLFYNDKNGNAYYMGSTVDPETGDICPSISASNISFITGENERELNVSCLPIRLYVSTDSGKTSKETETPEISEDVETSEETEAATVPEETEAPTVPTEDETPAETKKPDKTTAHRKEYADSVSKDVAYKLGMNVSAQAPTSDLSLVDICWLKTEDLLEDIVESKCKVGGDNFDPIYEYGKHYMDKHVFKINDFVIDVVLVNAFAIVSLIFLIFALKNLITDYKFGAAPFVKVAAPVCTIIWGGWGVYTFTNGWILQLGDIINANFQNATVAPLCLITSIVAIALGVINLLLVFITRTRYKVVKTSQIQS